MSATIQIVDFRPEHGPAFKDLNISWISSAHDIEDDDIRVLSEPQKYLIDGGGAVLIALHEDEVVGTCALRKVSEGVFEMTKMTVAPSMRGRSIGRLLGDAIVQKAKELGCEKLDLYSNRKVCAVAIAMYHTMGFEEVELNPGVYKRADIKMSKSLAQATEKSTAV